MGQKILASKLWHLPSHFKPENGDVWTNGLFFPVSRVEVRVSVKVRAVF